MVVETLAHVYLVFLPRFPQTDSASLSNAFDELLPSFTEFFYLFIFNSNRHNSAQTELGLAICY